MDELQISNNLKQLLESNLHTFPINKQLHYCERLYRITGDEKYIPPIKDYCSKKYPEFQDYINSFGDIDRMKDIGNKFIDRAAEQKNAKRMLDRIPVYREMPEFKYFQELVWYLNKFTDYGFTEILETDEVKGIFYKLKEMNWRDYFFNIKLVTADPVQTVNTVFHLKNLGLGDFTKEYLDFCNRVHSSFEDDDVFMNLLYFYTHVLISDSCYYQKFISPSDYKEIFDFIDNSLDRIIHADNNDIICEVGVCLKLAKLYNKTLDKLTENIKVRFTDDKSVLTKKGEFADYEHLEKVEHRNVLAIMLFTKMDKLYPGPKFNLFDK